jgi:hypothetical protein
LGNNFYQLFHLLNINFAGGIIVKKNKVLLILIVFFVGCNPVNVTENSPPTTHVAVTDTPTPEQTLETSIESPKDAITFDFDGKSIYTQLQFDDVETGELLPGFDFSEYGDAVVTTETDQVIDGEYSIRLSQYGHLKTNPGVLPLEGDTTYLVDFDYRILDYGNKTDNVMYFIIQPVGGNSDNQDLWVSTFGMLQNAEKQGSFTAGVKTGNAPGYQLNINSAEKASVVIDNIRVLRQDAQKLDHQPSYWENVSSYPYPRLGGYMLGTTNWMAYGIGGEPLPSQPVNQIERRLSMFDVLVGAEIHNQTIDPGFTYRLRELNPNIILLPYRIAQEQAYELPLTPLYQDATEDPVYNFQLGLADEWFVRDTKGNFIADPDWVDIRKMNISEFSPSVDGQTFNDYLINWILNYVMANGQWDGIFLDNLFGSINPHIQNYNDPELLDYDFNLNGQRDETPALASEMTRKAAIYLLEQLRGEVGDLEIIIGNTGPNPEIHLAQYVNGYTFECANDSWNGYWLPDVSEPGWRLLLQEYDIMQANNVQPVINLIEGCGKTGGQIAPDQDYLVPTDKDIKIHRFTLGTALLGDGFYKYDLFDSRSAPYWFDEYTVNQDGVAEEAPENKGYLGFPLSDAEELQSPAVTIWEESFESGSMPGELRTSSGIYISQDVGEAIDGNNSLVIDNPNHTQWGIVSARTDNNLLPLKPSETYVVKFDWKIIESLDGQLSAYIWDGNKEATKYFVPGVVIGDSGTAYFPTTLGSSSNYRLSFDLFGGGGKIAIDNIRVQEGGTGPWRRDFENGFVLVNPINKPYTFTQDELAGSFNRTGIKRILGTQAPDVNNGQFVTDSLTLEPFDAIILLADSIPVK